ncbi:unnamed protein product [Citrullus colocynthis]|uniref:Uncharacterized protein n=1 Tax=Citrullus colocynthis TaxID=252529 RepID=A0ABP0YZL6_9ROSI
MPPWDLARSTRFSLDLVRSCAPPSDFARPTRFSSDLVRFNMSLSDLTRLTRFSSDLVRCLATSSVRLCRCHHASIVRLSDRATATATATVVVPLPFVMRPLCLYHCRSNCEY